MDQGVASLPSDDDTNLNIDEIDEFTISDTSDTSRPSRTSHACTFDIQFDTLRYRGKILQDVQYRPRSKRVLNTKAKVSWVYQHGADLQAKGHEKLWLCKLCYEKKDPSSQLFSAISTSSIMAHLKKAHGITGTANTLQAQVPTQASYAQRGLVPPPFNDLKYKKNLIDMIIACDLSFAIVQEARFRQTLIVDRPEIEAILPTSHTTIKEWVLDAFQSRKIQIKDKISRARSKVNLSLDGWRAGNRDEYIAICSHFIDDDFKLIHCLLGFRKVYGAKSGQHIAEIAADVINDYEVGQNLGAFMMDNAGDNDTMLKELATRFDINVSHSRLRCLGHIINLVVKALLFGKGVSKFERKLAGASYDEVFKIWNSLGPIGKLHNICVYVNYNSARMSAFKECQEEEFQYYQLLTDGGIRWNSAEAMISRGTFLTSYLFSYYLRRI